MRFRLLVLPVFNHVSENACNGALVTQAVNHIMHSMLFSV